MWAAMAALFSISARLARTERPSVSAGGAGLSGSSGDGLLRFVRAERELRGQRGRDDEAALQAERPMGLRNARGRRCVGHGSGKRAAAPAGVETGQLVRAP